MASFLTSRGEWDKKLEGLGLIARLGLRQAFQEMDTVSLFWNTLTALHKEGPEPWEGQNFSVFEDIMVEFLIYSASNSNVRITPLQKTIPLLFKAFTSCPLSIREHPDFSSILDASVYTIVKFFTDKNNLSPNPKHRSTFEGMLDLLKKNKRLQTPYTKGLWANYWTLKGHYDEAKLIYDEILGRYVQTPQVNMDDQGNFLLDGNFELDFVEQLNFCLDYPQDGLMNYRCGAKCYVQVGDKMQARGDSEGARSLYEKARNIYDICLHHDSNHINNLGPAKSLLDQARVLVRLEDYEEACYTFELIIPFPAKFWRLCGIKKDAVYKEYAEALKKAGDEKGVTNLLMRQQQKILRKGMRQGKLIRNAVMFQRQQVEREEQQRAERRQQEEATQQRMIEMRTQEISSPQASCSSSQESASSWKESCPNRFLSPTFRKKQKTKGAPSIIREQEGTSSSSPSSPLFINVERLLTGTPLKIFNKFFESQRGRVNDNKVKIYLSEVVTLMTALGQKFDPRAGKGSHTKITVDPTSIQARLDEADPSALPRMVTLAKHDTLKSYQIKQMREMFEAYGLYPKDLIPTAPQ